jgi:hypothetical protein
MVVPNQKTRDREKMATLRTTSPSHNTRRVMRSRRTKENGVNTIKSLGTTTSFSKKSLVVELKAFESEEDYDYESNTEGGKWIIDVEPSSTVTTTKF